MITLACQVPEAEEALLNGEAVPETTEENLVNFMHDSQLDRSGNCFSQKAVHNLFFIEDPATESYSIFHGH